MNESDPTQSQRAYKEFQVARFAKPRSTAIVAMLVGIGALFAALIYWA